MKIRHASVLLFLLLAALVPASLLRVSPALAAPTPAPAMIGTWYNNDPATRDIVRITVTTAGSTLYIHPYGACVPTPCDMGIHPALVYAPNVSSSQGTAFTASANFGFKTTVFTGLLESFDRLTVISYNHFTDHSGRADYYYTDTFHKRLIIRLAPTPEVASIPGPALLGTWNNVNHVNPGLVKLVLSKFFIFPFRAHAYGACSPTPCDWGSTLATSYSKSVSSSVGTAFTAQYTFSFKTSLLAGILVGNRLVVYEFNHFTDHSGRSDYYLVEVFAKS